MGYIFDIRKKLGHDPIILTGSGVIIVNEHNEILLGKRADNGYWDYYEYPNEDKIFFAGIIYICFDYSGEMKVQEDEVIEQRFFPLDALPDNMPPNKGPVMDKVREYLANRRA